MPMGGNSAEDRRKFGPPFGAIRDGAGFSVIRDAAAFGVICRAVLRQCPFGHFAIRCSGWHGCYPSMHKFASFGFFRAYVRTTVVAILLLSSLWLFAGEPAAVNISLPADGMLLRANVPIFGSVRLPPTSMLKSWRLEYGAGTAPEKWILLKSGTESIEKDPNEAGEIKWNLNKEPTGNLTNWATGLGSYGYGSWQQNLNGIYTLRLVAETTDGAVSEVRRIVFIGEAILRTAGGTAISADQKCRILVPPFAFGGDIGRVVAIIKQVPQNVSLSGLSGVEDTRYDAAQIYRTIPPDLQLLSPIYRVYPNGFEVEPPATVEMDFASEALPGLPKQKPTRGALLRQYNPETKTWEPCPTTWFGNTASTSIACFAQPESYFAILRSTEKVTLSEVQWMPKSALEGNWVGRTAAGSLVIVEGAGMKCEVVADEDGAFSVPFTLGWEPATYLVRVVPLEGADFAVERNIPGRPGAMVAPVAPRLSVEARSDAGDYLQISCEDKGLMGMLPEGARSMAARIASKDARASALCELKESIAGSGIFLGRMEASDLVDREGSYFQQPLTVEVGGQMAAITLNDTERPEIFLSSPTHPNLLYLSGSDKTELPTTQAHSRSIVEIVDGAWRISGVGRDPSARVVSWPTDPFPAREWPIIGFTYRLFEPAPWQLHVRSGMDLAAFHFDSDDSTDLGLPVFARSSPLTADGHWHYWQGNLQEGKFERITGLAFGSWVKTGFRRVDPGFKGNVSQSLEVRDILIGRPSSSPNVEMRWQVRDRSPIKEVAWWVDNEPDSPLPEKWDGILSNIVNGTKTPSCKIQLPSDGRWFFHIQATDVAGNVSRTFHYPIFVFGTGLSAPSAQIASNALTWSQPEGRVKLPLRGWGTALDVKTLVLTFDGVSFPISRPIWDAGTEMLTLDPSSFTGGAPLGFNGEVVGFQISGKDLSGKQLEPSKAFEVKIQSSFTWLPEEGRIVSNGKSDQWIAAWEQPTAPWRKYFPGAANNVLIFINTKTVPRNVELAHWRRPVVRSGTGTLFLRESLNSPGFDMLDSLPSGGQCVFDASGTPIGPDSNTKAGDEWITQLKGSDPFQVGRLRVTMRRGRQLEQRVLDVKELQFLLDNQGMETVRIDAWLPPEDGSLSIEVTGDRRLLFGDEDDLEWRKAKIVSMTSEKQWRRVSVLVVPKNTYKKTSGAKVSGQTCW